jgi:hypothetical protein
MTNPAMPIITAHQVRPICGKSAASGSAADDIAVPP